MAAINITQNPENVPENVRFRAAVFGGTFNPVHRGHLSIAREIKERFSLDRVYVVPSAVPPHKCMKGVADASDRLAMLHLCFDTMDGFEISDAEMERSGPSYTIDTVKTFQDRLPDGSELFLVMGMDAFLEIDTWKSYGQLLALIPLIVMTRPGTCSPKEQERDLAETYLKDKISDRYVYCGKEKCFTHPDNREIHILDVTPVTISSTEIRNLVKKRNL